MRVDSAKEVKENLFFFLDKGKIRVKSYIFINILLTGSILFPFSP